MRRRLNIPYNYSTEVISEEMCRYVSESECEDADLSMKQHIASQKTIQTQLRKNPNLGNVKVLVLMLRFSDHVDRELIQKADIEEFWETKVPDWLDLNSQGRYKIDPVVIDWRTTDNTELYYSMGMRGIVPSLQQMAWPVLDELDNRPNWDWSEYDMDGNGELDSVVMIHSGYGAETTTPDCFDREFTDRIWAHAYSSSRNSWQSKDKSMKLNGYTVASAFHGDCGTEPGKIGLTVHEYMHTLGLEDLYDGVDPIAASGIGAFDIMAYPYGQNGNADVPGHLSIWSKILAEWAEPKVINQSGLYTLKASEISDEAYRINLSGSGEQFAEYLLIENRQKLEFDVNIWTEGLVIYHIDDAAQLMKNLGYPGQPDWPANGNHYQVALLPKDGEYHLEKGTNSGDAGDMWQPGDVLGPGMGGTVYPNTDRYQNGNIMETGLQLEVLSQEGTDITFRVGGFDGESQPRVTDGPTAAPTARATQAPTLGTVTLTTAPATPTSIVHDNPTVPTRLSYLDNFTPYQEQPGNTEGSYLSDYGTLSPQDSYLSAYDSANSHKLDAKGFISSAFEALMSIGGTKRPGGSNSRAGEILPGRYAHAKKLASGRNPEQDILSLRSTATAREGSIVFAANDQINREYYLGASRSAMAPLWGHFSSICLSLIAMLTLI